MQTQPRRPEVLNPEPGATDRWPGPFLEGRLKVAQINSCQGRWSIGLCTCTDDTIHFTYGNATLHILVADLRDLGMAMQKMAGELKPSSVDPNDIRKKGLLQ